MEVFGRYELRRRIGIGGMAEVFVAKAFGAEGFVKDVVIKRILPAFGEDPEFVRMFINEARLAAKLQHANIVQIYDFNHVEGLYYIAMEWVDGLDLRSVAQAARRRQVPLPARLGIHVGVETLRGLHHAHTRSEGGQSLAVVHRDISPHNLLLSFAGEVKITDFGIAKAAAVSAATRRGAVKGKLAYMSPEQVEGQPVDARSDLFSLGVVLWELLAGRRLYQADSEGELFAKVRKAEVPSLHELSPELPAGLDAVIRRLLAARVEDRYQSAAEALAELGELARIDDGLQAASYLQRLLPDQAGHDRRGGTEAIEGAASQVVASVVAAPPDAPTHTVGEAGEIESSPAPRGAVWADPVVLDPQPPATVPVADRRPWRNTLIGVLGVGFCSVALGWWGTGILPAEDGGGLPRTVAVRVEVPGGKLWVEGVQLGEAKATIEGRAGATLLLEARRGDARIAVRSLVLGAAGRVVLAPPDAGARDTRPAEVGSDSGRVAQAAEVGVSPGAEKQRRPSGARQVGLGQLSIIAVPWARVTIDGKDVGQTPVRRYRLSAGPHKVELRNSELGKHERRMVQIQPGKLETVRISWD